MADKPLPVAVFLCSVVVLAFAAAIGEARNLHRTERVALFDPVALCERATQYSKLCEKIARGPTVTSPATLVEANVAAAIDSAHKVSGQVASLLKSSSQDYQGIMGSALHACSDSYDSAIDALQQSQVLLKDRGSHDDLMTQLSAASTFVTTCQDSLDEVPEVSYPPEKTHTLLNKLVTNSLDLGAKLNGHNQKS